MFSNSLRMIKIDLNVSELSQIVCKDYNLNITAFVVFIKSIVNKYTDMNYWNIW
jgi:hypothetical protein